MAFADFGNNRSTMSADNKSEVIERPVCADIILHAIPNTHIRYFDLVISVPSLVFFVFLVAHCRFMLRRAVGNNSSIINTFFILLCLGCSLKVIRAFAVMIPHKTESQLVVDKVLWVIVRFFLLATEMSIVTFGVAAARLDSRAGIRRVLVVTSLISLTYTATQATLEFVTPDRRFHFGSNYNMYGHGGALFFFISSVFFLIVYFSILMLPLSKCNQRLRLPTKRIFYIYCAILASLYFVEAIGSILFYMAVESGLCVIDLTTLIYFIFYDPLVYVTFLHNYLRNRKTPIYSHNSVDFPDTSEEFYKTYSNATNSVGQFSPFSFSINNQTQKSDEFHEAFDGQPIDPNSHFYPDNLVTLDRNNTDILKISDIINNYNIISEGAQMDYVNPSSGFGCDHSSPNRSMILSLGEEIESIRRETWDLTDFANHSCHK